MALLFPEFFFQTIIEVLMAQQHPAYVDVATVDKSGKPHVRTVHLRYFQDLDVMAFATHIEAPKWSQLKEKSFLAGCYFDQHRQIEFRWEGPAELIDPVHCEARGKELIKQNWNLMHEQIRKEYWNDYSKGKEININNPCPSMGMVMCKPELWDIYKFYETDPMKIRSIHVRDKGVWKSRKASIINGSDLGPLP